MRYFVLIVLTFLSLSLRAQSNKDLYTRIDTVWHHFEELKLESYIDSSASRFLQQQDRPFVFKQLLPSDRPSYVGMLRMIYPEGVFVDLYVRTFEFTNPNGINQRKNINRFGRETIAAIRVHNQLACLNGCD
jgi:hypothetical protein